ncbi:unnamed protein product [Anisakis simplex]|uniref:All-trans-retinol 13,14-reductase (inferred by orthology to a human protein) n=1 Tax=Anisakis simplex TaxID=6269 RepID=A0A0M3J2E9_ANISI|nr:unnamed protein product [Anisakis simplex]
MHYALQMRPHNASHKICCAVTESQMTWQPIEDPFDVMIIGDKRYEHFGGNYNAFFKQLKEWFPDESDKISAYEQHVGQCLGEAIWWFRIKFIPIFITRLLIKSGLLDLITKMRKHIAQTLQQSMQQFGFSKQLQAVCSYYCVNYGNILA